MLRRLVRLGLIAAVVLGGCRTGVSYPSPEGPRHSGRTEVSPVPGSGDTLHVVTFNVAFGEHIENAIALLTTDRDLAGADIVLLQEMDASGTSRIAHALQLNWVYYPAIRSLRTGRDFGNAVLSRWPIIADRKIILPHHSPSRQRIATVAALDIDGDTTIVYSIHISSAAEGTNDTRADQMSVVLDDADRYRRVIVGGDLNDSDLAELGVERGYEWPTRHGRRTTTMGRWDHVLTQGFTTTATGTVLLVRGASDHRPVWVRLVPVADPQTPQ